MLISSVLIVRYAEKIKYSLFLLALKQYQFDILIFLETCGLTAIVAGAMTNFEL